MRGLAYVLLFWCGIGLVVAWAIGVSLSVTTGLWPLAALLIALPVIAFSAFLWLAFEEML